MPTTTIDSNFFLIYSCYIFPRTNLVLELTRTLKQDESIYVELKKKKKDLCLSLHKALLSSKFIQL